jgi:hypothetical protein
MLIRALKTTTGRPKGTVHEVDDSTGKELVAMGYAVEELPLAKQEAAPVAANDNRPLAAGDDQTGSPTGADAPQSSSQADQVLLQQELSGPEAAQESSPSTTDINSPHGQMSSMPATTTGGKRKRGRPSSKG